ncbi:ATP-binding protein [Mobilicoccus sp.]|uniref:sensor histidine kinase n=1 Tax=Mobilicoccus sp. TaxID=2034349 RepID=UPI00289FE782|nr:ATP-binding protein [Mobilicoccus sp.]
MLVPVAAGCAGLLFGAAGGWGVGRRRRGDGDLSRDAQTAIDAVEAQARADAAVSDVLLVLRSSAIVLDAHERAVAVSPTARALGFVRDDTLVQPDLLELTRTARRTHAIHEAELDLPRGPLGTGEITVAARAAPLGDRHLLLLLEDRTQARRVEAVRRDFVANVSHELKTPVGGIALLAEAVLDAADDPEAVARFARRIKIESTRLTRLVKEIVDLSRLQTAETPEDPQLVDIDEVVQESVDLMLTLAEGKRMSFRVSSAEDLFVYGDSSMLVTALTNLLTNAIAYSPEDTRITVVSRAVEDIVEISVTDQGRGISGEDQERVFERFYRVDAARSRATGGTGLGLAIVKHICANHGGEVTLWSQEGRGSTFTMRLPRAQSDVLSPNPLSKEHST